MDDLTEIFEIRKTIDSSRQPRHAEWLKKFADLLAVRWTHPYGFKFDDETDLLAAVGGGSGPTGDTATLPAVDYIYRLSALGSVMIALNWKSDQTVEDAIAALQAHHRRTKDWLNLSDYADGHLQNARGFSWWTTLSAMLTAPFRSGHHLGLLDIWIPVYAVVMRCKVDRIEESLARVPSVVDAVCSPVFAAARAEERPHHGVTIDLRGTGPVAHGVPEFALGPVPADLIELIPVLIPDEERTPPRVPKDSTTWQRLMPFYKALLE